MYRKGGPDTAAADGPRGPILAGHHLQRESLRDCRSDRSATISAQRPQVSQNCECHPKVPSLNYNCNAPINAIPPLLGQGGDLSLRGYQRHTPGA